jgi:hypothetical protein
MVTTVTRNNEIVVRIRGKTLLSEIQNRLLTQSVAITVAGEVIVYRQAKKTNCGIYSDLPLLPDTYKILYKNWSVDIYWTCRRMYERMTLWIPASQISYLSGALCSSDTVNVKIVTPYLDREMNPRMGRPKFDSRPHQGILFLSIASRHFLERTQHSAYWIPGFVPSV